LYRIIQVTLSTSLFSNGSMVWRTIFRSFDFERTWWRLFKKRVVRTKFDIYVFIITFSYFITFIVVADILNLISIQNYKSRKALSNNHSFTTWFLSNLEFLKRSVIHFPNVMKSLKTPKGLAIADVWSTKSIHFVQGHGTSTTTRQQFDQTFEMPEIQKA